MVLLHDKQRWTPVHNFITPLLALLQFLSTIMQLWSLVLFYFINIINFYTSALLLPCPLLSTTFCSKCLILNLYQHLNVWICQCYTPIDPWSIQYPMACTNTDCVHARGIARISVGRGHNLYQSVLIRIYIHYLDGHSPVSVW